MEDIIADLLKQRCDFMKQLETGDQTVKPGIIFIDNVLSSMIPDYMPPKDCACKDERE